MADVASGSIHLTNQASIILPVTLVSADETQSVACEWRADPDTNQCGLYRVSDDAMLWGGIVLPNGVSGTVTNIIRDPDSTGASYFQIVTAESDTELVQIQNSYAGVTTEENPEPAGQVYAVDIGSSNTGTYYSGVWHDAFMSWLRGLGAFTISGESEMTLTVYEDGQSSVASIDLGTGYYSTGAAAFGCHAVPTANDTYALGAGSASLRWGYVFLTHQPNVSSDERLKQDVTPITDATNLLMTIPACQFRLKDDPAQLHYGTTWQAARDAFYAAGIKDAAVLGDYPEDEKQMQGLLYGEFIGLLIAAVQEQKAKIDSLEQRIAALEKRIG